MTATATNDAFYAIIRRYVENVRADGRETAVFRATFNEPTKVIADLQDVSWDLGLRSDSESEATLDAWWAALESMLPYIAQTLRLQ